MAYAIKVITRIKRKKHVSWISEYGDYATSDPDGAERFGKRESAESHALLLAIRQPQYIGRLEVAVIVVGRKRGDVRWREKKEV